MMLRVERVGTESMQMEDAEAWMCACDVLFVRKESPFAYGSPRSATIAHLHPHSLKLYSTASVPHGALAVDVDARLDDGLRVDVHAYHLHPNEDAELKNCPRI